jgi:hypothetical protein
MAGDEAERFQRLQQRRQHGHDIINHGLAHRGRSIAFSSEVVTGSREEKRVKKA